MGGVGVTQSVPGGGEHALIRVGAARGQVSTPPPLLTGFMLRKSSAAAAASFALSFSLTLESTALLRKIVASF